MATTELSLKERLTRYFRNNPGWHAKGNILRMVSEKTSYTADNTGRRLRELENEGEIEVRYIKNHAHYRAKVKVDPVEWFDNLPVVAITN